MIDDNGTEYSIYCDRRAEDLIEHLCAVVHRLIRVRFSEDEQEVEDAYDAARVAVMDIQKSTVPARATDSQDVQHDAR